MRKGDTVIVTNLDIPIDEELVVSDIKDNADSAKEITLQKKDGSLIKCDNYKFEEMIVNPLDVQKVNYDY